MKPELSLAATGSLRSEAANANTRLNVCSDVVTVRTTSTSGIRGTGLKKCRPANRSARLVAAAIAAIEDLFGHVTHDRVVADRGSDLCDAAAHQAAAEHTNPLDVRHEFLSSWAWAEAGDSRTPCGPRRRSGRMSRATRPGWTTRGS